MYSKGLLIFILVLLDSGVLILMLGHLWSFHSHPATSLGSKRRYASGYFADCFLDLFLLNLVLLFYLTYYSFSPLTILGLPMK